MNSHERLMWVERNMPNEAALALARFTAVNRSWNGAGWADCLDVLLDSDSHLDVTEPLYEQASHLDPEPLSLVCAIAITLLYAQRDGVSPNLADVRDVLTRAGALDAPA